MSQRTFGNIPGITPGKDLYPSRRALAEAGIHRPLQAGISGDAQDGADSIVVSGGYEDDEDRGDVVLYTGEGGRDPATGRQTHDQELKGRNLALVRSSLIGRPVRLTRKVDGGYRYDGLFSVERYWMERGKSGHLVYRYRLVQTQADPSDFASIAPVQDIDLPLGTDRPEARSSWVSRIVRDSAVGIRVKELYGFRCQVCGVVLETAAGPYAESAHIRPLGRPHNGPDVMENVLCLCPNHHVLFDRNAFAINSDLSLIGMEGSLSVHPRHVVDRNCLRYHRSQFFGDPGTDR